MAQCDCGRIVQEMFEGYAGLALPQPARDLFHLHEVLFDNAQDIILYIELSGQIVNANKKACEQYGYTKEQLLTLTIQELRHPSTAIEYERQMGLADTHGVVFESIHVRSNGQSFPVEVSARSTSTEAGRFRVHIIRDITERKQNEEKISWLANYDSLTEIANRAAFIARLEEEIGRTRRTGIPVALMMFDIDRFKLINDTYGHEAGDSVLRHVAQAAKKVLRTGDKIGRLGGDEFVVLQTGVQAMADVEALARRILAATNETIFYQSLPLTVKTSIGIGLFPQDAPDVGSLLHCADKAMYRVKQAGGGSFCFFTPCEPPCTENRLCLGREG